jgi:hypothetical protein
MNQPQNSHSSIGRGIVLVENSTLLPASFRLEADSTGTGWSQVSDNGDVHQLEKTIDAAGWNFFYMAGTIQANAFGFDKQSMLHSALQRLFKTVKRQGCNCLEIDDVATHSFWGMPYVSVSAHSRRISGSNG